jgi:predicted DNA-binding transcriptional regulator AlpA
MQQEQFLAEKSVVERTTFSRATINRKVATGEFPAPIWISARRKVWKQSDVEAWMAAQVACGVNRGVRSA